MGTIDIIIQKEKNCNTKALPYPLSPATNFIKCGCGVCNTFEYSHAKLKESKANLFSHYFHLENNKLQRIEFLSQALKNNKHKLNYEN